MHPATYPSLPESLVFLLILAIVVFVLRVIAKTSIPLLVRGLRWIYNRISAIAFARPARRLYEVVAQRFPHLAFRVSQRFSIKQFTGLPLTLLIAAALYAGALVVELTLELAFEPEELANADRIFLASLQPFRSESLLAAFAWITDLGNAATLIILSAAATAFALAGGRTVEVLPLWVTVLGTQVFTWAGKFTLDRDRPEFVAGAVAYSPSFPSAHASGSLAVYGFVAYMLAREIRSPPRRFETVFWIAMLVGLIGFSRVFLHVHYASDVAAGYLVGGFWLIVGISIAEWRRASRASGKASL